MNQNRYPLSRSLHIADDWVHLEPGCPSLVIYLLLAAAGSFASLIGDLGAEPCLKPLPFGLDVHGNASAGGLLE